MSFRNILVVLRPCPAGISVGAVNSAVEMAAALAPRVSAIACAVKPRVPRSILGSGLIDVSGMVGEEYRKSKHDAEGLLEAFEGGGEKTPGFRRTHSQDVPPLRSARRAGRLFASSRPDHSSDAAGRLCFAIRRAMGR